MFPFDQPFNDLTFENRNKTYGAYVIRREYSDSLRIALLTAVGFIGIILVAGTIANRSNAVPKIELPDCTIGTVEIPVEIPRDNIEEKKYSKPAADAPKPPTNTLTSNVVATEETQKDTKDQNLAEVPATPGPEEGSDNSDPGDVGPDLGAGVPVTPIETTPPPAPTFAEEMPDVEGGILKFVARHLRYPENARENGKQGIVYISFVVEKDGSITDVNVLNEERVGYGCEEEAIRVIKSGKWKPGRNNGHALRVRLTMPIKYKLQ
jgi:periplasmic protein TonB